ncbi:MAG: hypothetical protein ACFFDN_44605 [Candidatus Hodarchaeota archaeon]
MKFSRRVNYALLGFLIMANIAFRYPTTNHETGIDTFHLHTIANSISHYGYATWIVHPFSFFGLTPETVPTAYPYILSGLSQLSGLNMEYTILLFSMFLGLVGAFNCYLMAKEIKNDDLFIFIVVFAFSLSPVFLGYTIWNVTGRNLFLALFPLFIWSVFRNLHRSKIEYKYIGISIILFIILLSIHRMTMLIPLFILAFFISIFLYKKLTKISAPKITRVIGPTIWILVFGFFIIAQLFEWGFYSDLRITAYWEGYLFKGGEITDRILNMGVDYGSKYGPLFLFGILGAVIMLFFTKKYYIGSSSKIKINRSFNSIFFPLVLLFYAPLLLLGVYTSLVILPFICLIIGFGVIFFVARVKNASKLKSRRTLNKIIAITLIFFLIFSILFAIFMLNLWRRPIEPAKDTKWMSEETYDTGMYLNEFSNGSNYLFNNNIIKGRIIAITKEDLYLRLNLSRVTIERGSVLDLYYSDTLYIITSEEYGKSENIHSMTFEKDLQRITIYLTQNNIKFSVEKSTVSEGQYVVGGQGLRISNFFLSTYQERYKIYDNGGMSIWNLD